MDFVDFLVPVYESNERKINSYFYLANEAQKKILNVNLNLNCSIYKKMVCLERTFYQKFLFSFACHKETLEIFVMQSDKPAFDQHLDPPIYSIYFKYETGPPFDTPLNYLDKLLLLLENRMVQLNKG